MAFAPARDRGAISSKGGGVIKIKEVNDDGSDLSTTATIYDIGFLQETTLRDNTTETVINDETGDQVQIEPDKRVVEVEGILQQSDKATLDVAKETRGKYYALYKYNGIKNGKHQEVFYGLGRINPSIEVKYMGGTVPFKFTAIKLVSSVSIAGTTVTADLPTSALGKWGGYVSATVTIAANDYYTIVETAV